MLASGTEGNSGANGCSVLLVEDNKINQKVVILMLGKLGIEPTVVDGGQQAIEAAKEKAFDLVLMDLHMPGMDGTEAARRIKQELGDEAPPIVALTADAILGRDQEAVASGLDAFLTKPVNSGTLRACINKFTDFNF